MATKTAEKFDLHAASLGAARDLIQHHIEADDGEKCFNLYTYLERLSSMLGCQFDDTAPLGRFELDGEAVARYLWACIALEGGDQPYGSTFRGMPILD